MAQSCITQCQNNRAGTSVDEKAQHATGANCSLGGNFVQSESLNLLLPTWRTVPAGTPNPTLPSQLRTFQEKNLPFRKDERNTLQGASAQRLFAL